MYNDMSEKRDSGKLKKAFKKHFKKNSYDMDDEEDEQVKPMNLYQGKKDRRVSLNQSFDEDTEPHGDVYGSDGESTDENRMYGENAQSNDEDYDSISPDDDDEYEMKQKKEIEKDSQTMLPKSQRRRMGIAVLTKKMSKPKK